MDGKLNLAALKEKVSLKLQASAQSSKSSKTTNNKTLSSKPNSKPQNAESKSKRPDKGKLHKSKKAEVKLPSPKASTPKTESGSEILKREAMAMGASVDDLKLVEDLDDEGSEIEFEVQKSDNGLKSELASFVKTLGIPQEVEVVDDDELVSSEEDQPPQLEEEEDEEEIENQQESENEDQNVVDETADAPTSAPPAQVEVLKLNLKSKDKITDLSSVNTANLDLDVRSDWFNIELDEVTDAVKPDRFAVERLTERGQAYLDKENSLFLEEFSSRSSQRKFLSQILSDGTLNDKISALTLLVQESPMHNLKAFDTLLGYCDKKSRTAALQAIASMKDLFTNSLLPDRKLVSFKKQLLSNSMSDKNLAVKLFEDHLKTSYFKFIEILERLSQDPVLHIRMNVITHIFDLLKAKPEQEANLLRLGVNKLGDKENKVAAKTSFQILQLEQAHPAMKKIIVNAVNDAALQKLTDFHSQYYTVLTLNQTILTKADADLANSLVKAYFSLFEKILYEADPAFKDKKDDSVIGTSERGRKNNRKAVKKGKKGGVSVKATEKSAEEVIEEKSAKMFSALLTGLNRAFPYCDLPSEVFLKHLDTLFKITHSTNFNTAVQALVLVQHIVTAQDLDQERYYRTLYESLLDPRLVNSLKQNVYLNLLFKSIKADVNNKPRVYAFVKRILQVSVHWLKVGVVTGMLYLLIEIRKVVPEIMNLLDVVQPTAEGEEKVEQYDPLKRNPTYANADKTSLWELLIYLNHYHPTVSIYADAFINGTPQAKPDLNLYTLAHFLDRFVYKNAKHKPVLKGLSIMQPLGGAHTGNMLMSGQSQREVPMNTIDWLSKKTEEIRPDEKFFHQYFVSHVHKIRNKKVSAKQQDDELDEEDGGEQEVWDALVKSRPDVEGPDEDDDLDFSDLEAEFSDLSDDETPANENLEFDDDLDLESEFMKEVVGGNGADEIESDVSLEEDDDEDDEEAGEEVPSKKRKADEEKSGKRKKLLSLPVFASVDEYSKYLSDDEE